MLIDTVGFINKLPHQLVDAFKSTLEEVRTADLLLHVVDATHPRWAEQQAVVERVLEEIGAGEKPVMTVFNKLDRLTGEPADNGQPWQRFGAARNGAENEEQALGISALTGAGLPLLLAALERRLEHGRELVHIDLPLEEGKVLAWLRRSGKVVEEAYTDTAVSVTALISPKVAGQLRKLLAVETAH
jgi:GTP-binding protein HflX